MDVTLKHNISYDVSDSVSVEDLVNSITAHSRLLRGSADLLVDLLPGLEIEPKKISVARLSQESPLTEIFAFAIIVTYQKELETEVPQLIEHLSGAPLPEQYDTLVTVLVMLIAVYGIEKAYDRLFPGKAKGNIDSARDSLLRRAAEATGIGAKRIMASIEVLFTGKSSRVLVSASQRVFAPTRNQPNASIRDGRGTTLIPSAAVRDAQAASGLPYEPEDDEKAPEVPPEFHRDVRIILHAMDRDRKRRGWAGHCPDLFEERIPMHLEKSIRQERIFGKDEIRGDILLTFEADENGDRKPKEFLLIQAYL